MTCRGKKRFESAAAARKIIDRARERRRHGALHRQENRAYDCRLCNGWHVTSAPYIDPEAAA